MTQPVALYYMKNIRKEFRNELGNLITIQSEGKGIAGQKGVLFAIEGTDSSTTVHITQKEAEILLEQLSLILDSFQ